MYMEQKMEQNNFVEICDKFIKHVKKYSQNEEKQLKLEQDACAMGVISSQNYEKLKLVRENKICTLNILGYSFKKLALKSCDYDKYIKLLNSVKSYIS